MDAIIYNSNTVSAPSASDKDGIIQLSKAVERPSTTPTELSSGYFLEELDKNNQTMTGAIVKPSTPRQMDMPQAKNPRCDDQDSTESAVSELTGGSTGERQVSGLSSFTGEDREINPATVAGKELTRKDSCGVPSRVTVSTTAESRTTAPQAPGDVADRLPMADCVKATMEKCNGDDDGSSGSESIVKFGRVHIRLYERILSDNPAVTSGPPLGLGWNYKTYKRTFIVDEWEKLRAPGRREFNEMIIPRTDREAMLAKLGYSQQEIAGSVRNTLRVKSQRMQTVNNLDSQAFEEFVEQTSKSLKRLFLFQACTSKRNSLYAY